MTGCLDQHLGFHEKSRDWSGGVLLRFFFFLSSLEKTVFLVNSVNWQPVCEKEQQKKAILMHLLIYGLSLDELCNNGICSHNIY